MIYKFPYKWAEPISIPDKNLIGIYEGGTETPSKDETELIAESIANPIGLPKLSEILTGKERVLILCDDNTRPTPAHLILPILIKQLKVSGIIEKNIEILIATGTHRRLTNEELEKKLGKEILETFPVYCHHWTEEENLFYAGSTSSGIEVWPNKKLKEADFIIGIGIIIPHAVAGFSGGGKIIVPGVCGEKTAGEMHWQMVNEPTENIFGVAENRVRRVIDEVAMTAGLRFIINVILNNSNQIVGVVSGHPVKAHRVGTEICRRVHGVKIPRKADIVIIDSFGTDLEYWQAIKAMTPVDLVLKKGGCVIHIAECPDGISKSHPEVLKYGYRPIREVLNMETKGLINKSVACHMVQGSRILSEKGLGFLVAPGISRGETEMLGFKYAANPQEALNKAFALLGERETSRKEIIILRQAGDILPILENN